jgi:hypothetical protein
MPAKRSKSRARSPPLSPDVDTYIVGTTWTDAEREFLVVFFAAINSAAEQKRHECVVAVAEYGISVKPSRTGDGVFCSKDVPQYTRVGHYAGVVEKASAFKVDDYSIELPPIAFPCGTMVNAVLSGYEQRMLPGSASMFNHSCMKFNAHFVLEDVYVKKNMEAGWEVHRLMAKKDAVIPEALLEEAAEILYTYPVVIVMTHLATGVAAGDEIRVTYNRVPGNNAYFCTRKCAKKLAGKSRCIVKCMCEPDGCPLKRYYVTDRVPSAATP